MGTGHVLRWAHLPRMAASRAAAVGRAGCHTKERSQHPGRVAAEGPWGRQESGRGWPDNECRGDGRWLIGRQGDGNSCGDARRTGLCDGGWSRRPLLPTQGAQTRKTASRTGASPPLCAAAAAVAAAHVGAISLPSPPAAPPPLPALAVAAAARSAAGVQLPKPPPALVAGTYAGEGRAGVLYARRAGTRRCKTVRGAEQAPAGGGGGGGGRSAASYAPATGDGGGRTMPAAVDTRPRRAGGTGVRGDGGEGGPPGVAGAAGSWPDVLVAAADPRGARRGTH